jgi:hypothetical protein
VEVYVHSDSVTENKGAALLNLVGLVHLHRDVRQFVSQPFTACGLAKGGLKQKEEDYGRD